MKKNKKQRRIMFLLILILCLTLGFALLSTTLYINGTANIKSNTWDIHWDDTSVSVSQGSVSAETPEVSGTNDDTVSFEVELELPGDFYEFTVDAVNEGSVDGAIDTVSTLIYDSSDLEHPLTGDDIPEYLLYSVTYSDGTTPADGDVLAHGESQTYKVRVEYDEDWEELAEDDEEYVIEVKIPYVQYKEEPIRYNIGDLVYLDPKTEDPCNSTTFDLDGVKANTNSCYKWRVIGVDNDDITIQLDHNLGGTRTKWGDSTSTTGSDTAYVYKPTNILSFLIGSTMNWTRLPLLNFSYDTSAADTNGLNSDYGTFECIDGSCKFKRNGGEMTFMFNARARMITVEEVRDITNMIAPSTVPSQSFTLASTTPFYFSNRTGPYIGTNDTEVNPEDYDTEHGNTELAWLIENTNDHDNRGAPTTDVYSSNQNFGYWTLSPRAGDRDAAWVVREEGRVSTYSGSNEVMFGARPVATVPASMLTK